VFMMTALAALNPIPAWVLTEGFALVVCPSQLPLLLLALPCWKQELILESKCNSERIPFFSACFQSFVQLRFTDRFFSILTGNFFCESVIDSQFLRLFVLVFCDRMWRIVYYMHIIIIIQVIVITFCERKKCHLSSRVY